MTERQIIVKVAHHAVGRRGDVLVTFGLGSCVAIVLHDPIAQVGGMAHVLLPEPNLARDTANPDKFASTAIPLLVREVRRIGAAPARLEARIIGGAAMFASIMAPGSMNMGERNVQAVRGALEAAGVPIRGEDVGGDYGRSVRYIVADGTTHVTSVSRSHVVL
jgi:chemotaxis protein CheD